MLAQDILHELEVFVGCSCVCVLSDPAAKQVYAGQSA